MGSDQLNTLMAHTIVPSTWLDHSKQDRPWLLCTSRDRSAASQPYLVAAAKKNLLHLRMELSYSIPTPPTDPIHVHVLGLSSRDTFSEADRDIPIPTKKKPFSRVDVCRDEGEFHLSRWRASACFRSMSETSNSSLFPRCNSSVLVFRPWGNLLSIFDH
jgi:hypothetical protein